MVLFGLRHFYRGPFTASRPAYLDSITIISIISSHYNCKNKVQPVTTKHEHGGTPRSYEYRIRLIARMHSRNSRDSTEHVSYSSQSPTRPSTRIADWGRMLLIIITSHVIVLAYRREHMSTSMSICRMAKTEVHNED